MWLWPTRLLPLAVTSPLTLTLPLTVAPPPPDTARPPWPVIAPCTVNVPLISVAGASILTLLAALMVTVWPPSMVMLDAARICTSA
ncbi:Uncharacterised protein [Chromobacterium violaceum]|uniref:Uncharacterized protein n=1 Tax=Chromobacterium violaceum TaxID=536 RepID=A0A3S4IWF7_CHRVL|nr:Uncharacterised protein [Chromobacterium violaceum]